MTATQTWETFPHDADVGIRGFGDCADLDCIEEHGRMEGAEPEYISERARRRQRDEMGTLGSGNHYLEVQEVSEVFDARLSAPAANDV